MTLTSKEWNEFVAASSTPSFLQSWEWGEMQRLLHVPLWRLAGGPSGTVQAVSLVLKRALPLGRSWLYAPRGPVVASLQVLPEAFSALQESWEEIAAAQRSIFFRCDPAWPAAEHVLLQRYGFTFADREVQPRETLIIDLTRAPEELLAGMHQKTRYNIRVGEKRGITIRFAEDAAALETFLQLCSDVEARSPFRYHPPAYYRAMREALVPSHMFTVALAELAGQPLAAHLLISFADTVTYAHGASSSQQRDAMAPHLLQWESIKWAQHKRARRYDFFGIAPDTAPVDHPWAGITRFKMGFGGTREAYVGAHDLVHDTTAYTLFTLARRMRRVLR